MRQMKLQPLGDRVVLKRITLEEEKTAGGIFLPDTAKEKPQEAEVIAVGPGKLDDKGKRVPPDVKDGDRVIIAKWGGTEIKIDGVEYVIVSEDDILAKLAK
ncbi:MAG: co-chaperone GroES [bacterium]